MTQTTEWKNDPKKVSDDLIIESNRLATSPGAGLMQGMAMMAAGLFAVAAAIREAGGRKDD